MIGIPAAVLHRYSLSVASGDLLYLQNRWYVTHSGLLRLSRRRQVCRNSGASSSSLLRSGPHSLDIQGYRLQVSQLSGICWIWRRRPVQRLVPRPRRRDASGRNASRQSRPAEGLRYRHLLGRRDRVLCRTAQSASRVRRSFLHNLPTGTAAVVQSAIASAKSFASISSILIWSRPTRPTSAA